MVLKECLCEKKESELTSHRFVLLCWVTPRYLLLLPLGPLAPPLPLLFELLLPVRCFGLPGEPPLVLTVPGPMCLLRVSLL